MKVNVGVVRVPCQPSQYIRTHLKAKLIYREFIRGPDIFGSAAAIDAVADDPIES
jgi:hypothetical protein